MIVHKMLFRLIRAKRREEGEVWERSDGSKWTKTGGKIKPYRGAGKTETPDDKGEKPAAKKKAAGKKSAPAKAAPDAQRAFRAMSHVGQFAADLDAKTLSKIHDAVDKIMAKVDVVDSGKTLDDFKGSRAQKELAKKVADLANSDLSKVSPTTLNNMAKLAGREGAKSRADSAIRQVYTNVPTYQQQLFDAMLKREGITKPRASASPEAKEAFAAAAEKMIPRFEVEAAAVAADLKQIASGDVSASVDKIMAMSPEERDMIAIASNLSRKGSATGVRKIPKSPHGVAFWVVEYQDHAKRNTFMLDPSAKKDRGNE